MHTPQSTRYIFILLSVSLAFILFTRLYTPEGGVITVGDSVSYVAAMRSLQTGTDMVRHDGSPYVLWPPLYPIIMLVSTQIGTLVGLDLFGSLQYLNHLTAAGSIIMLGLLARRSFSSPILAVCFVLAVVFSWPFFVMHIHSWSEPVYILLILIFLYVFADFFRIGGWWRFALCILLAALLNIQRYASMMLTVTAGLTLLLFLRRVRFFSRIGLALTFGVLAMVPLGLWYWRNYQISGGIAGIRRSPGIPLTRIVEDLLSVIGAWFVPPTFEPKWIVGAVVLMAMAATWVVLKRHYDTQDSPLPVGVFYTLFSVPYIFIYFVFFAYTATRQTVTLDDRNMIHVFTLTFLLLFLGLDTLLTRFIQSRSMKLHQLVCGTMAMIWLVMVRSPKLLSEYPILSQSCCRDTTWEGTALVTWLSENKLDGQTWTNDVYRASLYAGIYPTQLPKTIQAVWAEKWTTNLDDPSYLIWFLRDDRVDFKLADLEEVVALEPLQEFDNGIIFQIIPPQ